MVKPHLNKSVEELAQEFEISKNDNSNYPKNINSLIINRILNLAGNVENAEEFFKANIKVKTIRVKYNDTIEQSMSFPIFKIKELVQENWEDATLHTMLESTKFFFVIFKANEKGEYVFKGCKFWFMPESDINDIVRVAWQETVATFKEGVRLTFNKIVKNNLISKSDNRIIHVRPHTRRASYVKSIYSDELPTPAIWTNKPDNYSDNYITKQCFWLNNDYILKQIQDLL
jgi:hypothetical protein